MTATLRILVGATAAVCAAIPPLAFAADPAAQAPQPLLEIDQKMPDSIEAGAPFLVEVAIRNAGGAPAEGVTATDQLPAGYELLGVAPTPERTADGLIWRVGRLGPGEQTTLRLRLVSKAGEPAAPPRNAVDATFQGRASSVRTAKVARPELTLGVTGPDATVVGQSITYRIVISNNGPVAAHDVALHALLGEGLTNAKGSDLEAGIGALAPGESRTVNFHATATRPGDLRGSFGVQAQGVAPVQRECVCRAEDDRLSVTAAGPTVLHPEFTGLFGLTVANDGSAPAHQVVLTATLPDGLTFVRGTDNAAYDAATHTVRWDLGDVQPGERRELAWNGTARAAGDLKATFRLAAGGRRGGRSRGPRGSSRRRPSGRRPASSKKAPGSDSCRARHRGMGASRRPCRGSWRRAACSFCF